MTIYTLDSADHGWPLFDLDEVLVNITRVTGFYQDFKNMLSAADIAELGEDLIDLIDTLDADLSDGQALPQPWQRSTPRTHAIPGGPYRTRVDIAVYAIQAMVCEYYDNALSLTTNQIASITIELISLIGLVDNDLRQGMFLPEPWSVCR